MESFKIQFPPHSTEQYFMNPIPSIFRPTQLLRLASTKFRCFSSSSHNITTTQDPISGAKGKASALKKSGRVGAKLSEALLKEKWLDSLTRPVDVRLLGSDGDGTDARPGNVGSEWVIGVDPDVSGALAVLKSDGLGISAQVFDSPQLKVLVGRKIRRRLDAKSLVLLVQSLNAPLGTTAYIEQSIPYPQDGKQGWWGGGFGYGLWIGILVTSGFTVVPVPSMLWKKGFRLSRSRSSKDDSRELASALFPSLSSQLTRKKDHGRAEAVLIAAYGKGLKLSSDPCCTSEGLTSQEPEDCHVLLTAQKLGVC